MKAFTLVSSLLAVAYAAPAPAEAIGEAIDVTESSYTAAPLDNPLMRSTDNGVKILPRFSATKPKDGAQRTTIKYGSYMVSSSKMLSTTKLAKGPCPTGGCYVTAMEATIRYPDTKEANVDTGAWLHHIALFGSGTGGGSIWAAGNERPTLRLNTGEKFGIDFPSGFMLMIDLMSEDVKAKNLTLEISYEHVSKIGSGYKPATMYWLTIGEPMAKQGVYSFNSIPMTASGPGSLLYAIGHMHDGGDNMSLFVNSKNVCKSVMHYNAREGYKPTGGAAKGGHAHGRRDGGPHGGGGGEHISDPGACTDFGTIKTGDRLTATAYYDAKKHPLMMHNGKAEKLMGNMRVYVGKT